MSYDTDIKTIRDEIKRLDYREIPNILDMETQDVPQSHENMGFICIPQEIIGEDVTSNSNIGSRSYKLQLSYKAINSKEYDIVWNKFEALYRALHAITRDITSNGINKKSENQFIFIGTLEFNYGERTC